MVANSDCRDIQNHLATFSTFKLDPSKEIDQAIIRIPLRTSDQAKKSKIVDREVSVDEIKDELRQFAQEMKDGGLLFLKYIRTIILRIDNDIVAKLQILENDPDSLKARNELPLDFQRLYVEQESSILRQDITKIFELQIEYSDGQVSSVDRYLVQHTMLRSTGNQELDKWARKRKLFPWTAVAAPLNVSQSMLH